MSRRTNTPKVDLKLNLSPPRSANQPVIVSQNTSVSSSPGSSCVSSEPTDDSTTMMPYPSSPEGMSMVLVGCPRCLMYVMLSEVDPNCPKCKSTVLLDLFSQHKAKKASN
ncbi:hypothetical protein V6Z12_A05G084200 [Gossypium hirsutum]